MTDHPFGGDTHPMHAWDEATKAGVQGWLEGVRDQVHAPRLEAAAAAVNALETNGASRRELEVAHAEYQAAIAEHEHVEGKLRTLAHRTPESYDQVIVGGENGYLKAVRHDEPGGWQHNEQAREALIAELNTRAAAVRDAPAAVPPDQDQYVAREPGGTMGAAQ